MNAPLSVAASAESAEPSGTAVVPAPFPAGPVRLLLGRGVAVVGNDIDTDRIIPRAPSPMTAPSWPAPIPSIGSNTRAPRSLW
jgi:hypothetical protein